VVASVRWTGLPCRPAMRASRSSDYHVITGAGSSWPQAFYYGMCILEEMQ